MAYEGGVSHRVRCSKLLLASQAVIQPLFGKYFEITTHSNKTVNLRFDKRIVEESDSYLTRSFGNEEEGEEK